MTNENRTFETTIPFQGFYCSIHDDQIDSTIETYQEDYLEEDGETQEQVDSWYDKIDFNSIRLAYVKHYVDFANSELGLASLTYKALESPREYNFLTDRIFCTVGYADIRRLYVLYAHTDAFKQLIKDKFTSYDGFMSFYSNDVSEWIQKGFDTWDHNEMGMLILCHWKESDINEMDSLDWNMTPMSEVISNELPAMESTT